MRVVVDTNQLLRMAAAENWSPLFIAWAEHRFNLVISIEMLTELEEVILGLKHSNSYHLGAAGGLLI